MLESREREACFKTVVALCIPEEGINLFEGKCPGKIAVEKRENKERRGFFFDKIFIPGESSKTFSEMSQEEKSKYSHRAKALENVGKYLNE